MIEADEGLIGLVVAWPAKGEEDPWRACWLPAAFGRPGDDDEMRCDAMLA